MKIWAWDEKNLPSITHAIRTAVAATTSVIIARLVQCQRPTGLRSLLGRNESTLGATLTLSLERIVAIGRARGKFLWRKPHRLRSRDCSRRIARDRVSLGEDGVSLRQHYPRYHRSDSAFGSGVDNRAAPVPRSLSRNHCSSRCPSPCGLNINGARGKARMSNAIFATTYLSSVFF